LQDTERKVLGIDGSATVEQTWLRGRPATSPQTTSSRSVEAGAGAHGAFSVGVATQSEPTDRCDAD